MPELDSYSALDDLLLVLDAAPVGAAGSVLKTEADREYYETQLMFAVRKLQAAQHHLANIERMLDEDVSKAKRKIQVSTSKSPKGGVVAYKVGVITADGRYVHELSACLAAIRSGLDFLASVAGRSLKGVSAHSMRTLEELVEKGFDAPALAAVRKHADWLRGVREYRDEVVHRLVVRAPATGWIVSQKGDTATAIIPVVVPRQVPSRVADTRRVRAMDVDVPHGISMRESYGEVTSPDGSKQVLEHRVAYAAAPGFVRIDLFIGEHLAAYDALLADMFSALAAQGFTKVAAVPFNSNSPD